MKAIYKWIIYGTSLGLLAGTSFAQNSYNSKSQAWGTKEQSRKAESSHLSPTGRSPEFFAAKGLIGAQVNNKQNQDLGDVKDIVFDPQNGETFAAVGVGHGRCALIPWQALRIATSATGKTQLTVNTSKEALDSGPSVAGNQWQELSKRSFAQSVYKHYNLQPPAGMGGIGSGALGASSTSSSKSSGIKYPTHQS